MAVIAAVAVEVKVGVYPPGVMNVRVNVEAIAARPPQGERSQHDHHDADELVHAPQAADTPRTWTRDRPWAAIVETVAR